MVETKLAHLMLKCCAKKMKIFIDKDSDEYNYLK